MRDEAELPATRRVGLMADVGPLFSSRLVVATLGALPSTTARGRSFPRRRTGNQQVWSRSGAAICCSTLSTSCLSWRRVSSLPDSSRGSRAAGAPFDSAIVVVPCPVADADDRPQGGPILDMIDA